MKANEPVAYVDNVWINRPDLAMDLGIGQMFSRCQLSDHQIPLYTHPAKEYKPNQTLECSFDLAGLKPPAKTLTDEEIRNLQAQCHLKDVGYDRFIMRFAKAILRKAQEK